MNTEIKELLFLEKHAGEIMKKEINSITKEIESTPLKGVKPINNLCFTVSLSTLKKEDVWSPEYYSPTIQATYVRQALEKNKTIASFVKTIKDMIETKYIKIGCNKHRLNGVTIAILKQYSNI